MMIYKSLVVGCCCVLMAMENARAQNPQQNNALVISLQLDKAEVTVGKKIVIEELVPKGTVTDVRFVTHAVLRIGQFDMALQKVVNLKSDGFIGVVPKAFKGLSFDLMSSHPRPFDALKPKGVGFKETVEPYTLGVFLITAKWLTTYIGKQAFIVSNPVVLVVKPPLGADGKPVIKPEWLKDPR